MSQWQDYFHHPSPSIMGLLTASMSMGSMLAIPIVPYCADILGRRMGVVIGCAIMLVGIALLSMGFHIAMFIMGRLLLGFGIAIAHGSAPLLIAELVHPQHRAIYSTIYNTLWYLGSLIGAWVSFGTNNIAGNWAWRVPCLLQAIPSLFQIFFIWFVPESPRWLIAKGKHAKAKAILTKYHAADNENDELVSVEYHEIQQTISLEQEYEKTAWSELWSTPGNRHRLLILVSFGLFSQWSGNALVSYYLSGVLETVGIKDDKTKLEINGYLSIVQLVSAVGICFFVDKIGRRPLFLTSCVGMLVSFIVETIGSAQYAKTESTAAGHAVIVFIFIYFIFYNLGFCGLLVSYSTEILPYRIRAKVCFYPSPMPHLLPLEQVDADHSLTRVSPSCSCLWTSPSGSTNMSTPLPWRPLLGSTTWCMCAGSPLRHLLFGSGSSRPRTRPSRRLPSISMATPQSLVAMLPRSRHAILLETRTR
jgi:sugar porter (SP) family MFS transporter